jgi:hypothetical protein
LLNYVYRKWCMLFLLEMPTTLTKRPSKEICNGYNVPGHSHHVFYMLNLIKASTSLYYLWCYDVFSHFYFVSIILCYFLLHCMHAKIKILTGWVLHFQVILRGCYNFVTTVWMATNLTYNIHLQLPSNNCLLFFSGNAIPIGIYMSSWLNIPASLKPVVQKGSTSPKDTDLSKISLDYGITGSVQHYHAHVVTEQNTCIIVSTNKHLCSHVIVLFCIYNFVLNKSQIIMPVSFSLW